MQDFLDTLNDAQREAVMHTEGPTMIIAGAGSGKTRVLTFRIARLITQGVDPFNILALTFTNKASREMRHRIESVVGSNARNLWMGTFHSVFARILRSEAEKLGYPSNFTIYDTDDSKSLLRTIVKELKLDDKIYRPNIILGRISSAKNMLISSKEYLDNPVYSEEDESTQRPELGKVYQTYQLRCFKAGAMDFDDLLFNTNILLEQYPDVLNKFQHLFRYVLVDEFQDTNLSQYRITKRLAAVHQNICVVGDDSQSIYAFRGADIRNILNFEKDYSDLKVFKLEQNYRSTKAIVGTANSLITHNKTRLPKIVWTENTDGDPVEIIKSASDNEEGRLTANAVFDEKMHRQRRNSDFAILYRTNAQSRSLEEAFRKIGIKYRIYGGQSFYQRKEIKDVIAYLRFTVNHKDEASFKRIINLPRRGIGDTSVAKIITAAAENDLSLWEVICNSSNYLQNRAANAVGEFVALIKSFKIAVNEKNAYEATSTIAKGSGLLKELFEDKSVEGISRYENVQELLNGIKEFTENSDNEDKSMGAWLQDVSLLTDQDQEDEDNDRVTMMTVHASKGLEFKHVFVVGLEEDLFPSQVMMSSRADLEEERRLFYVAMTRAEEKLTLSHAAVRYRYGTLRVCEPSRFLKELDQKYIKQSAKPKRAESIFTNSSGLNVQKNLITPRTKNFTKKVVYQPSPDFEPSNTASLTDGMRVEHQKFGFGIVKDVDAKGNHRKAKVEFDGFGEKTLLLSFAKLKIHNN